LGLPDLFGSSGPILKALEVSGVELFLPPVIGAPGYAVSPAGDGHRVGFGKIEDFKANPSLFGESMDLSELSDGIPRGEAHQVHGCSRICR